MTTQKDDEESPPPPEAPAPNLDASHEGSAAATESSSSRRSSWRTMTRTKAFVIAAIVLIVVLIVAVIAVLTLTNNNGDDDHNASGETAPARQSAALELELHGITPEEYNENEMEHNAAFEKACVEFFSEETKELREVRCEVLEDDARRRVLVSDLYTYVVVRYAVSGIGENPMQNYRNLLMNILQTGGPNMLKRLREVTTLFQKLERIYVVDDTNNEETPTMAPAIPGGSEPSDSTVDPGKYTGRDYRVITVISERVDMTRQMSDGPYKDALEWILRTDPQQLDGSAPNLFQRYAAAYFYYATGPWSDCGPTDSVNETMCYSMWCDGWDDYTKACSQGEENRWLTMLPECDWMGVTCNDNGQIIKIEIDDMGLQGIFPFSIHFFDNLEELSLRTGAIVGPLPAESLHQLKNLVSLDLEGQTLGIPIAKAWDATKNIERVNLDSANLLGPFEIPETENFIQSFSARWNAFGRSLSPTVGRASNLKVLNLGGNSFTGVLPDELYTLSGLEELHLDENGFGGGITSSVTGMTNLKILDLHHDMERPKQIYLKGSLPPAFPGGLEVLDLEGNSFSGTLPDFPIGLTTLKLKFNNIGGFIPESLYDLQNLNHLNLADNLLTGTISSKIGQLTALNFLRLSRNELTGNIPSTTDQMVELHNADFSRNNFTGFLQVPECSAKERGFVLGADCFPADNVTEVDCPCCTWCCSPTGDLCVGEWPNPPKGSKCYNEADGSGHCSGVCCRE